MNETSSLDRSDISNKRKRINKRNTDMNECVCRGDG